MNKKTMNELDQNFRELYVREFKFPCPHCDELLPLKVEATPIYEYSGAEVSSIKFEVKMYADEKLWEQHGLKIQWGRLTLIKEQRASEEASEGAQSGEESESKEGA